MKTVPLGTLFVTLCLLPVAAAQPHRPEPQVHLYSAPGFVGEHLELEPGAAIGDLRDLTFPSGRKINDKVSSIRLEGGARVVLFADPGYSGDRVELAESVRDLRQLPRSADRRLSWDDCITSLRVPGHEPERRARDPRWRRPPEREAGAVLYSAPNFTGETLWLEAGTTIDDLRDLTFESGRKVNDKVSSIRLEGGARVTLFADPRFTGDRVELTESVPDLRQLPHSRDRRQTWDDCITSLRVSGREPERRARDPRWRRPPEREAGAVLYSAPNFTGETLWLEAGTAIDDLRDLTFESGRKVNDKVSSVRLEGGARVTLFADPRFTGDRVELTESAPDLRQLPRSPGQRESWDDCVTAVRVSRGGMNRPDGNRDNDRETEQLITRAFRDLLRRPPTPEEMLIYHRSYLEHRWSERQLRDAIRENQADRPGPPPHH